MERQEIYRLANALDIEYNGDLCELYAHVCNHIFYPRPNEDLVALKCELEHRISLQYMDEHHWMQTDTGHWFKFEDDGFWDKFNSAKESIEEKYAEKKQQQPTFENNR